MRYLLILLLSINSLYSVEWPYIGAEIETNGWVLKLKLSTSPDLGSAAANTNGMFYNGFGTNNSLTLTNKLWITLQSPGYDSLGNTTVVNRVIYGTKLLRFANPNHAINNILAESTTNIVARIALSDFVYSLDTAIFLYANTGAFATTNGSPSVLTNSAAISEQTVTNSSTQTYPKAIANWSYPGWNRETNSTLRLRAVGFHSSARNGQPLACMKFIATDESGDAVTNVQPKMKVDYSLPDILPTGEYVADISQSSFTQGDSIRCDFVAYPWIGDTNAVLDTTRNLYEAPLPTSITNLCDKNNAWTDFIAVVGTAGAAPRVTNVAPNLVNSAHYFGSIQAANDQLAASNSLAFSHPDSGGSVIYLRTGIVHFAGGTVASNSIPKTWTVIQNYPGDSSWLSGDSGTDDLNDRVKIKGIYLNFGAGVIPFSGMQMLWVDQCRWDVLSGNAFQMTNCWVTHCSVTNLGTGFRASSISSPHFFRLRGNNLNYYSTNTLMTTFIGNFINITNGGHGYRMLFDITGQGAPHEFQICYNNYLGGSTIGAGSDTFNFMQAFVLTNGAAIIQNVFEKCGTNEAPLAGIASANSKDSTNLLIWHNIFVGERIADFGCSGTESTTVWRNQWSHKNNIYDLVGIKKDYDTAAHAARTGNWSLMNQVNSSGNLFIECMVNKTGAGSFPPEFAGLNTYHPPGSGTNLVSFAKFVNRKAYAGDFVFGLAGGDYKLQSSSPGFNQITEWILPFDLEGVTRGKIDAPGAFSSGNVRKGGFF